MTRRTLIAGNWKMHKTVREAEQLVIELKRLMSSMRHCDVIVAPPYTALWAVARKLEGTNISLAAQELYPEPKGAFTGAVSADMLMEVGCRFVLVGHSERRQIFGETLQSSTRRMGAALAAGLRPILCVGETLQERDAEQTTPVVGEQLDAGLEGLSTEQLKEVVVAYEPVWAIGTGKVASPAQAQQVHAMIRERIRSRDASIAESIQILYGGSVKPNNAAELLSQPDIDGALVGGASLDAESFAAIARATK
jgi:triosephosphate isomerase